MRHKDKVPVVADVLLISAHTMTQKHKECPKPNVDYSANNKNIVDIFRIKMDK